MNKLILPVLVLALVRLSCAEVGVVVEFPNGTQHTECIDIGDGSSAYKIMKRASIETVWTDDGMWGRALCMIDDVGSDPAGTSCSDWSSYWAFSLALDRDSGWTTHSPVGSTAGDCWNRDYTTPSYDGHYCARDGDVLGYHFTDQFPSGYPRFFGFEDICGKEPKRGVVKKKQLMSSRPYWKQYAEDCGIDYTDRIPAQNLVKLCRDHKAEQLLLNNDSEMVAEDLSAEPLKRVDYDYRPKLITDLKKPFTVILTSGGGTLGGLSVSINGREYILGRDGSVSFPVERGSYRLVFSQPGFEQLKVTFRIGA